VRSWFNLFRHFKGAGNDSISIIEMNNVLRDLRFDLETDQLKQLNSN